MGQRDGSLETEVHSIIGLPQEGRKILNKQSNPTPKIPSKTATNKAQTEWKKIIKIRAKIIKIRVKINDIET